MVSGTRWRSRISSPKVFTFVLRLGCFTRTSSKGSQILGMQMPSPKDTGTRGRDAPVEELKAIGVARALPRFRALPDDTGIALEGDKGFARVSPILKLLDGHVVAGLAAGTTGEERPRDIDHVQGALALIEQRRAAPGTEASARLRLRVLEASDASLALRHTRVLAPTADIGRIGGAVRATACRGVIVPGPKGGKVDLQLHRTAKAETRHAPARWLCGGAFLAALQFHAQPPRGTDCGPEFQH